MEESLVWTILVVVFFIGTGAFVLGKIVDSYHVSIIVLIVSGSCVLIMAVMIFDQFLTKAFGIDIIPFI